MIDVSNLKVVRPADAPAGCVVAMKVSGSYQPALRVQAPGGGTPGLLIFPSGPNAGFPRWATTNNHVMLISAKPRFLWEAGCELLADLSKGTVPVGHLLVTGGQLAISGVVPNYSTPGEPTYWQTSDGEVVNSLDFSATVAVTKWQLAVEGSGGEPVSILSFP